MPLDSKSLSVSMKTAVALLVVFTIAIILAFAVTIITGTTEIRFIALAFVTPLTILNLVFVYYCRQRRLWSYVGAAVIAAIGISLRVAVSTMPSLEVGGGLPSGVTALYIVIAALVVLKCYESILELRG